MFNSLSGKKVDVSDVYVDLQPSASELLILNQILEWPVLFCSKTTKTRSKRVYFLSATDLTRVVVGGSSRGQIFDTSRPFSFSTASLDHLDIDTAVKAGDDRGRDENNPLGDLGRLKGRGLRPRGLKCVKSSHAKTLL